jgi:uncharacterized protein
MPGTMRLDRYTSVEAFLAAAGDFLVAREPEHNLMLGIASSAARNPGLYDADPYLAVVSRDARVVAAALRTPPYNAILSEVDDAAAVELLVEDLRGESLPGLTGPPGPARAFAEHWVARHGGSWRMAMEERVYALSNVIPPRSAAGAPRIALPSDRDLLERWLDEFGREALPQDRARQISRTLDDWLSGGRRFWLWEDEGDPVSLVGAGGLTPNGIRIGPVYTPIDRRGRGYASNLTAAVSRALLNEGRRFCFLYTDLANPTSNRIYQAIGYVPVTDAAMISFAA